MMGSQPAIVAIMAGGRGVRLGGEKALVRLAGRPLIEYVVIAAHDAGLETVVVAKPGTPLPPLGCRILRELDESSHPLHGIVAALRRSHERCNPPAVVVVACDMPFLTGPLLHWLATVDSRRSPVSSAADGAEAPRAVVAKVDGRLQPLLARFEPCHLPLLERSLRQRSSLRTAVLGLGPWVVTEQDLVGFGCPRKLCFNVNSIEDLKAAHAARETLSPGSCTPTSE